MDKLFKNNTLEQFTLACDKIIYNIFENEEADHYENYYGSVKNDIRDIIRNTCCSIDDMSNILHEAGYEEEKIEYFLTKFEKNKHNLLYHIIIDHNSKQGEAMSAFDWAVKFICGSSELKTLKYPILELSLTTCTDGVQKQRLYEMDKIMLARLIHILENSNMIK